MNVTRGGSHGPSFCPAAKAENAYPDSRPEATPDRAPAESIANLEAFDPQKARKRAPAILELEAAIDKALSSAFGYGTPAYLRYNEAATLDPSPLLTNVAIRAPAKAVGGPGRHDAKVQETREYFSENKTRAITLLQKAIRSLEEEIALAEPKLRAEKAKQTPTVVADAKPEPKSAEKPDVRWLRRGVGPESISNRYEATWDGG